MLQMCFSSLMNRWLHSLMQVTLTLLKGYEEDNKSEFKIKIIIPTLSYKLSLIFFKLFYPICIHMLFIITYPVLTHTLYHRCATSVVWILFRRCNNRTCVLVTITWNIRWVRWHIIRIVLLRISYLNDWRYGCFKWAPSIFIITFKDLTCINGGNLLITVW